MKELYSSNLIHSKDIYSEVSLHVYYQDTTRQDTSLTGKGENIRIWKNTKIKFERSTFLQLCNQVFFKRQNFAHIFVCNQHIRNFKCSCNTVLFYATL